MSEKFGGGGTSDVDVMPTLFALAKMVCSSGSYATPGQLVPPTAFPMLIAPSRPFTSPRIAVLYIHDPTLYRLRFSSACARSSGVESIRSSGTFRELRP